MTLPEELTLTLESNAFACDSLRIRSLLGRERIGRLFELDLEIVCLEHDGPNPELMAGARVTVVFERPQGSGGGWHGTRRIHGIVAEVDDLLSTHLNLRGYRLHVVPRAFALSLLENQAIFMRRSIPEIIREKLEAVGLGATVDMRLTGEYPTREFVVQYKESDLAFVSRLAEHLGISVLFEHDDEGDRMVFTDHAGGFQPIEGAERIAYRPRGEQLDVFALESKRRIVPAFYAVRDYNYRIPHVDLTVDNHLAAGFAGGVIDYGSHYKTPTEGAAMVRVRAEERQATQLVYSGQSNVPALSAGMRFTLEDHPDLPPTDLLVTEVEHRASQVVANIAPVDEAGYRCAFRATPADRTFRPPRTTPRPRISGLVTGILDAGPGGSMKRAQIDEHGRYMVRFLFDTSPALDIPPSHPVRMAQNHVGESYGTHLPLKPGMEVVISFIDGDPDRPVIVGALYNPLKPSPVERGNSIAHRVKTQTGITVDMVEKT